MAKIIRRMMMFTLLFVLFSIPVNAETQTIESNAVEEFLGNFDMSSDDLYFNEYDSVWDAYEEYFYSSIERDLNQLGGFSFSGGLEYKKFSTFSDEKALVGYGSEDTVVGLLVYKEVDDEVILIDSSLKQLGASGLYSENINFECEESQYLLAAVMQDGIVQSRIYQITTKKEATRDFLENIDIDFLSDDNMRLAVPDFELPVRKYTGIDF